MKAAVLHEYGTVPRYEDFPDPAAAVVISSAYAQIVQWTRDGKLAVCEGIGNRVTRSWSRAGVRAAGSLESLVCAHRGGAGAIPVLALPRPGQVSW